MPGALVNTGGGRNFKDSLYCAKRYKVVIAYSSVVHIALVIAGVLRLTK